MRFRPRTMTGVQLNTADAGWAIVTEMIAIRYLITSYDSPQPPMALGILAPNGSRNCVAVDRCWYRASHVRLCVVLVSRAWCLCGVTRSHWLIHPRPTSSVQGPMWESVASNANRLGNKRIREGRTRTHIGT